MPAGARQRDSILGAAAVAYFSGVHSSRRVALRLPHWLKPLFSKELLVGILFVAACALPTWNRVPASAGQLLLPAYFAALAWLNCHAIDHWESGAASPCVSGIVASGILLGLAALLLAVFLASSQPRASALVICGAASALLLALLDGLRLRLTPLALRAAADLVLLTPLALLLQ